MDVVAAGTQGAFAAGSVSGRQTVWYSTDGTDWVAVVQERRTAALEPVQEMKLRLTRTGLWALVGSCGLIGLLWYFVGRALIDRTPRLWPLRPNRLASSAAGPPTPSGLPRGL